MRPERSERAIPFPSRSFRGLAAILFALVIVHASAVRAAPLAQSSSAESPYDAQSFAQELTRLKAELDSAGKSTEALRAYRESLPKLWSVDAAGRHFNVPTNLLASRIAAAERQPDLRQQQLNEAREYLDALASEAASLSAQPSTSTDAARAKLDAILARSEFVHVQQQSWWQKIRERINEILFNALMRIFRGLGGQKSLGYVLLWLGVCAAAVLIAWWIFQRWFRVARMEELAVQAGAVPSRSWQEWVFAAREASGRGDNRTAIHCAYCAGIARLQEMGALSPDRSKTPREYLRALAKSKPIQPETVTSRQQALSLLTSRMEKTWYGYHAATQTDFRESLDQLETLGCHLP